MFLHAFNCNNCGKPMTLEMSPGSKRKVFYCRECKRKREMELLHSGLPNFDDEEEEDDE